MSITNGTKGGVLVLLGCIAAVALTSFWTKPAALSPTAAQHTTSTASPTLNDTAMLAVQVARVYKPGESEEKFRLGKRKVALEEALAGDLLDLASDPALEPGDPVKNKDALRRILSQQVTDPEWPEEAVRMSDPGVDDARSLCLSDPVSDLKVKGRYYFLAGVGTTAYDGLGLLTVDVPPNGAPLKLEYDIFMSTHGPMPIPSRSPRRGGSTPRPESSP